MPEFSWSCRVTPNALREELGNRAYFGLLEESANPQNAIRKKMRDAEIIRKARHLMANRVIRYNTKGI